MRILKSLGIYDQFRNGGLSPYPTRLNTDTMSIDIQVEIGGEEDVVVRTYLIEEFRGEIFANIFKAMFQYYSYYIDHKIQTWEEKNS